MTQDRFARLSLAVEKVQQFPEGARPIAQLLVDWGLANEPQECMWVIAYDAAGHIRTVVEVARGGHAQMSVEIPEVIRAVLTAGGECFTIAHNHPTLGVLPSVEDHQLTHRVMDAANVVGLVFEEHLIVTPQAEFFSFREAKLLNPAKRDVGKPLDVTAAARKARK